MDKTTWDGPKWGPRVFFAANPDLADILGRTDFDFEIFFLDPKFPDFQVPDFQNIMTLFYQFKTYQQCVGTIPKWICDTFQPIVDFLWAGCWDLAEIDPPSCSSTWVGC